MSISTDPEKRAKQLANLRPFEKDDKRINRAGRKPGIRNWSTIVQNLLADEELLDKHLAKKPSYWNDLPNKNAANAIGMAMIIRAMSGDKNSAEWLRKTGFGDKLIHDFEEGFFDKNTFTIEIVKPEHGEKPKD